MKTTKNYFNYLFIALTLVFSISLSSCSDDDENVGSKNDLIGTWQCIHSEGYEKDNKYPEDNDKWDELHSTMIKLSTMRVKRELGVFPVTNSR